MRLTCWLLAATLTGLGSVAASDLAFDRTSSRVTVRVISETTHAALDFAAWDRNPVFH